jgi:hypothetical protein
MNKTALSGFIIYNIAVDWKEDRKRSNYTGKIPGTYMRVTWARVERRQMEFFPRIEKAECGMKWFGLGAPACGLHTSIGYCRPLAGKGIRM